MPKGKEQESPLTRLIKSLSAEKLGGVNYMTDRITGASLFYIYQQGATIENLTNLSGFVATYMSIESGGVLELVLKLTEDELISLLQAVFTISIALPDDMKPPLLPDDSYAFLPGNLTLGDKLNNTHLSDYGNPVSAPSVLNDIVDSVIPYLEPRPENKNDSDQARRDFVKSLTKDSVTWMLYNLYGSLLVTQAIKKNIQPQLGIG